MSGNDLHTSPSPVAMSRLVFIVTKHTARQTPKWIYIAYNKNSLTVIHSHYDILYNDLAKLNTINNIANGCFGIYCTSSKTRDSIQYKFYINIIYRYNNIILPAIMYYCKLAHTHNQPVAAVPSQCVIIIFIFVYMFHIFSCANQKKLSLCNFNGDLLIRK